MFCEKLKKARINAKLTQEQVAKILNTTQQAISRYENGTREPDIETLCKFCYIYHVSADELLELETKKASGEININNNVNTSININK